MAKIKVKGKRLAVKKGKKKQPGPTPDSHGSPPHPKP